MKIVDPAEIELQLQKIWEEFGKEKKTRASTFNLVVFGQSCPRLGYYRTIMQRMIQKFPCRILFITEELIDTPLLETAISVLSLESSPEVACDQIDIRVSKASMPQVPFLILPHFIPDLPIYLLWTVDPNEAHPLFSSLLHWATRVIFDSECTDHLTLFAQKLIRLKQKSIQIADLNWARIEPWRHLLAELFNSAPKLRSLRDTSLIEIVYNSFETEFFTHLEVQALYLVSWFSQELGWTYKSREKKELGHSFVFLNRESREVRAQFRSQPEEKQKPGALLACRLESFDGLEIEAKRAVDRPQSVNIQVVTRESCELPYQFLLGETQMGQSLVKEIYTQKTSRHFLDALEQLIHIDPETL